MIPFTQYMLPDGRKKDTGIERPAAIEALASKIIEAGFRFEAEVLGTGSVSLTIVGQNEEGEEDDLDIEVVENGPEVREAIDRMIMRFASKRGEEKAR